MESRDNASVFLSRPHVITFGTIFLAGLRSDEGMISVLAHELMHIADGDNDSLRPLVTAVGNKASDLTGLDIHGQRGEEITCDLIGAMAVRTYIADTPGYESIARRLARSIQHNCVELDEGDEDHLSPRNTIRALLALNPVLVRELINDREERTPFATEHDLESLDTGTSRFTDLRHRLQIRHRTAGREAACFARRAGAKSRLSTFSRTFRRRLPTSKIRPISLQLLLTTSPPNERTRHCCAQSFLLTGEECLRFTALLTNRVRRFASIFTTPTDSFCAI